MGLGSHLVILGQSSLVDSLWWLGAMRDPCTGLLLSGTPYPRTPYLPWGAGLVWPVPSIRGLAGAVWACACCCLSSAQVQQLIGGNFTWSDSGTDRPLFCFRLQQCASSLTWSLTHFTPDCSRWAWPSRRAGWSCRTDQVQQLIGSSSVLPPWPGHWPNFTPTHIHPFCCWNPRQSNSDRNYALSTKQVMWTAYNWTKKDKLVQN